jgi:hypothetical protein
VVQRLVQLFDRAERALDLALRSRRWPTAVAAGGLSSLLSRTECGSAPVNVFAVVDVNDEHNISRPPAEGAKVPDPQSPR